MDSKQNNIKSTELDEYIKNFVISRYTDINDKLIQSIIEECVEQKLTEIVKKHVDSLLDQGVWDKDLEKFINVKLTEFVSNNLEQIITGIMTYPVKDALSGLR